MPAVLPGSDVAVTGASGFIGSHVVRELLSRGYKVRAVLRDPSNKDKTAHLVAAAAELGKAENLTLCSGDLGKPGSFDDAFAGAAAVVHTAAVVSIKSSNPHRDIVDPSVNGTKNVLTSVDKAGTVKRIVHTSSVAAIQSYDKGDGYIFTEKDEATWSTVERGDPYGFAKLGAEQLVMGHARSRGTYDVVAINPVVVFGPCLTKAHTKASPSFVRQFVYGNEVPNGWISCTDVREAAFAHAQALAGSDETVAFERFLICTPKTAGRLTSLAKSTAAACPDYRIKARFMPAWKTFLFFNASGLCAGLSAVAGALALTRWADKKGAAVAAAALLVGMVGALKLRVSEYERKVLKTPVVFDSAKSASVLGVTYRPLAETLLDTVSSMVESGWVKCARSKP